MQLFKVGDWVDRAGRLPQAGRHAVPAQRPEPGARRLPRPRRGARDLSGLCRVRLPDPALRRRDRGDPALRSADRRDPRRDRPRLGLAGEPLRRQGGDDGARGRRDRARDAQPGRPLRGARQAARGAPPPAAHPLRHGDDARARLLPGHRELLADPRRAPAGQPAVHADRLLPRRLRPLHRRVPPDDPAARRHVRGRLLAQVDPGRLRLPPAERRSTTARSSSTSSSTGSSQMVLVSATPGPWERAESSTGRRADRPPDRDRRSGGRGPRDQEPDRRPDERGPGPRRARTSGCWSRP